MDSTPQAPTAPMSYGDVSQEWENWRSQHPTHTLPLDQYARVADEAEGSGKRASAYNADLGTQVSNWLGGVSKEAARTGLTTTGAGSGPLSSTLGMWAPKIPSDAELNEPVATTGLAGVARKATDAVVPRFGQTAQNLVEGAPRMGADVLSLMTPAAPAGIADMGLSSYAGAREKGASVPRSLAAGGIGAGTAMLAGPAEKLGSSLVAKGLARTPITNEVTQRLGEFLGGQAAIGGTMAAGTTAQDVASGETLKKSIGDQLTPENIFAQLGQQVPFAALGIHNVTERPTALMPDGRLVNYPSRTALEQVKLGLQAQPTGESGLAAQFTAGATPSTEGLPSTGTQAVPTDPLPKQAQQTFQEAAFGKEPDFSLTNQFGANFGSTKDVTPAVLLDRILAGEVRPTNAPDNQNNVALVSQLQQAFADPNADYADMNKVANAAELANLQQRGMPLTPAQQSAWTKLSPVEQQGAHVASKILNDPYSTLGEDPKTGGLDARRWEVDDVGPDTFMRSIYRASANMMEKWDRPITTVQDAAALVRDVNGFTGNVQKMLVDNGFSEAAQAQLVREGVLQPITQDTLSARYNTFLQDYLNNPSAEAASRSLQWVKNQVWITANHAKEQMLRSAKFASPELSQPSTSAADSDTALEQKYQSAVQKVPELQDLLNQQYLRARQEVPTKQGGEAQPNWRLDAYRNGVAGALEQLTPEQLEKVKSLDPQDPRAVLDKIPVTFKNDEGQNTRTNLGKVIFEPRQGRVFGGSARREVGGQQAEDVKQATTAPATLEEAPTSPRGTQDPSEVLGSMDPTTLQASYASIFGDRAWKKLTNMAPQGQDSVEWAREALRVDATGDTQQRQTWAKANPEVGLDTNGDLKNSKDIRKMLLSGDAIKVQKWTARITGMDPDAIQAPTKTPRQINPKAKKDFLNTITGDLLQRGYQPEVANAIARFTDKIANNFYWLDNVDFAKLADRNGAAQELYKTLKVMGLHLPDQTIVGGRPIQNPMIALMQKDLVDKAGYAPLNTFWKITAFGHEAFHQLQDQVVNNKFLGHTNEDTQTVIDSVNSMHAMAANMSPEDRQMSATALVDMMIPPKYARDAKGQMLPEVKGIINAVSANPKEYSAFMYQMATAGLGSKLSDYSGKLGVPQANKIVGDYRDHLSWFSQDTMAFMRGQFRQLGDFLDVLQRTLDDPDFRKEKGLVYTQKETRNVQPNLFEGDVVQSATHDLRTGQSTGSTLPTKTVEKPATFTTPPTAGVGQTTRAVAEAALRIAQTGERGQQYTGPITFPATPPSHFSVLKKLAQVDPRWERATSTIKQLISNLSGQGTKTVDLTDVQGAKDFMSSVGMVPPVSATIPFQSAVDAAMAKTPAEEKYNQDLVTRFISPLQYNTSGVARRGLDVAEQSRQNIDKLGANAHIIAQNMRGNIIARVGAMGKYGLDQQTAYYKFLHDSEGNFDHAANTAMSKILRAQQEQKGLAADAPGMQKFVAAAVKGLPQDKKLMAVSAVKDVNGVYANAMASHIKAAEEHQTALAAHTAMLMNPGKFKTADAMQVGQLATKAAQGDLMARAGLVGLAKQGQLSPASLSAIEAVGLSGWDSVQKLHDIAKGNGNFASEGRFGRYVLFYKDPLTQKQASMGFDSPEAAKEFEANRVAEGATGFRFVDKQNLNPEQLLVSNPDAMEKVKQIVQGNFNKQLEAIMTADPVHGPEVAKALKDSFNPTGEVGNYTLTGSLEKLMKQRRLAPGREYINPVANMEEYVGTSTRALSRRQAQDKHALYQTELRQQGLDQWANDLDAQFKERLAPTSDTTTKLTTIGTAMYIGGDVARSVIDSTLGFTLGLPEMMHDGASVTNAHAYYGKGMAQTVKNLASSSEFNASARRGYGLENTPVGGTPPLSKNAKQDTINYYLQRMNDENKLSRAPILDTLEKDSENMNLEQAAKVGNFKPTKPSDLIVNPMYSLAKVLLQAHAILPNFNQKISAHAALEYKYDQGMRGEKLYQAATTLLDTMTAAAGRGNKPVGYAYLSGSGQGSEFRRSAVSYATMMQQYGLSQTFGLAHMFKDAFSSQPGLTPKQRLDSLKGATYGLSALTALAGSLGVTGVSYAFAGINKILHKDPEAATREGLQNFFNKFIDSDQEHGALFADTVMNGLANRLTGLDFAGRAGVSSLFGISPGEGGNIADLLGPNAGIVSQLVQGVSDTAAGKPWLGLRDVAPRALKSIVEMSGNYKQFGDLRINDQNNNLIMQPNAAQAIGYAMGFSPAQVRQQRQEGRLMKNAQDNYQITHDAQINSDARDLLDGNTSGILSEAYSRQYELGFNPRNYLDSVMERALDMQTQKDPMTRGSVLNSQSQDEIGSTFDNPRTSEMQRLAMKNQMVAKLGMPFGMQVSTQQDYLKAQMVDQLRQTRGMGRQEALAWVQRYYGI